MKKNIHLVFLTMFFLLGLNIVFKPSETFAEENQIIPPGGYAIKSMTNTQYAWDIMGGIPSSGLPGQTRIITYPYNKQTNQTWFVLYKANDEGYVILNDKDRRIISAVPYAGYSNMATPNNNIPFNQNYPANRIYNFKIINNNDINNPIVLIQSKNMNKNSFFFRNTAATNGIYETGVGKLSDAQLVGIENNDQEIINKLPTSYKWKLEKFASVPEPELSNVIVTSPNNNSIHYVGEKFHVTGSITTTNFNYYDLYSQFGEDSNAYTISENNKLNLNSITNFDNIIDTSNYIEGTYPISIFARADSAFVTNTIDSTEKYTFIYPTPSGEPVLNKRIPLNTDIDSLNPADFVKNLTDEMGNTITVEKIEDLDTSKFGEQIAKITIKNRYKSTVIDVPVIIGDVPTLSWDDTKVVKDKSEELSNSAEMISVSFFWKPSYIDEEYYIIVKNKDEKIASMKTKTATSQGIWVKEDIEIPLESLSTGESTLSLEMYYTPDGTGNLFDSLALTINKEGVLELLSVPNQLNWTNRIVNDSKGILTRDSGNKMQITVSDTRELDDDKKTWFVSVTSKLEESSTLPFDFMWKSNRTSTPVSLTNKQNVLNVSNATKNGNIYTGEWDEESGIVISSSKYLKVGNYSNKASILWQLYDTPDPD